VETLRLAMETVQQNLKSLAIYAAAAVLLSSGVQSLTELLGGPLENPYEDPVMVIAGLGSDLFLIISFAVLQSIIFSRMGKNIDRPLWKISGDWEALRRYFPLWFALNAVIFILKDVSTYAIVVLDSQNLAGALFLLLTFFAIIYIPAGAAIMFGGPVQLSALGEVLRPLIRQAPRTLIVLMFAGLVFFFSHYLVLATASARWLWPLISIVEAYFDCVIFAAIWLICMYDRQNPEESDLDF
jgi:hypothetical protein